MLCHNSATSEVLDEYAVDNAAKTLFVEIGSVKSSSFLSTALKVANPHC